MTGDMVLLLIGTTVLIGGFNLCLRGTGLASAFNIAMGILFVCIVVAIARS